MSVVSVDRPSVFLLSFRLGGFSSVGVVSGSGLVGLVLAFGLFSRKEMPGLGDMSTDGSAGGERPSSPGWLWLTVGSSGMGANIHGAGSCSERGRNVSLRFPLR